MIPPVRRVTHIFQPGIVSADKIGPNHLHGGNPNTDYLADSLELLPEKAIWWARKRTLILSDLHLGKAGHFRKSGLAAPGQINEDNLNRLTRLLQLHPSDRLLILGDLFHSTQNREWDDFAAWRMQYPELTVQLVAGNHDLLPPALYRSADIATCPSLLEPPFLFLHDASHSERTKAMNRLTLHSAKDRVNKDHMPEQLTPEHHTQKDLAHEDLAPEDLAPERIPFTISGHVHPGIRLRGKGRQSMRLPCFFARQNGILLPAFGTFTGLHILKPAPDDQVFAIAEQSVIPIRHQP